MSDKGPDIVKAGACLTLAGCALTLLSPILIILLVIILGWLDQFRSH